MNTILWIVQIALAFAFFLAGTMKISQPREKLVTNMGFVEDFTMEQVRLIGVVEILGAIGLILPAVTGILPILSPLAALGLALTMVGAIITNVRRGDFAHVIPNLVLMVMALFVAYGRFLVEPF